MRKSAIFVGTAWCLLMAGMVGAGVCIAGPARQLNKDEVENLKEEAEMRQEGIEQSECQQVCADESPEVVEAEDPIVYAAEDRFMTAEHTWEETEEVTEEPEVTESWIANDYTEPETAYAFTADEEDLMVRLAYCEAECYGSEGMAYVIRVVLNRVESDQFPDTIIDVIMQEGQFGPVTSGDIYTITPTYEAAEALQMVEAGWDETYGATYFCTVKNSEWHMEHLTYMFTYKDIYFFTYLEEH